MLPPIRSSQGPGAAARPRRAGPAGFALPEGAPQEAAAPSAATAAQALLAFQEEWSPAEADAAAQRRAQAVLGELGALQLALLGPGADPARLSRLALLAEGEAGADPVLREIMQAISLRARVELARHNP
jgi:hypothetical protein